jgi:hypothetical protein
VIKIPQLFLRPVACLTSTLLETGAVLTTANAASIVSKQHFHFYYLFVGIGKKIYKQ